MKVVYNIYEIDWTGTVSDGGKVGRLMRNLLNRAFQESEFKLEIIAPDLYETFPRLRIVELRPITSNREDDLGKTENMTDNLRE